MWKSNQINVKFHPQNSRPFTARVRFAANIIFFLDARNSLQISLWKNRVEKCVNFAAEKALIFFSYLEIFEGSYVLILNLFFTATSVKRLFFTYFSTTIKIREYCFRVKKLTHTTHLHISPNRRRNLKLFSHIQIDVEKTKIDVEKSHVFFSCLPLSSTSNPTVKIIKNKITQERLKQHIAKRFKTMGSKHCVEELLRKTSIVLV